MTSKLLAGGLAAAAFLLAPLGAAPQAQDGASFRLSLGYDGRLLVKVLDMQIEERANARGYGVSARLISTGILALLKHVNERASAQGRIAGDTPRPEVFEFQHLSGKTKRRVRTTWTGSDVEMTATPPFRDLGDPAASREQKLAAVDPLTGLMRLTLTTSRATACRQSLTFFDGKQLYALDFSNQRSVPPTLTEQALGLVNHFRCDVRFREVAGFARKKPGQDRSQGLQRPIELDFGQLGQGGPWVISKLHAPTPLGWATIELKRAKVEGKDPTG